MGAHHTKDKGDLGTAMAYADLVSQGCMVLFPATEHAPFDLVAYRSGRFHRVQVKYRTARSGKVVVSFRSSWADRHGTHMKPVDKAEIDALLHLLPGHGRVLLRASWRPQRGCDAARRPSEEWSADRRATVASEFRRLPV